MRTNIEIDDKLLEEVMIYTGMKSKKDIVNHALEEFLKMQKRQGLKALQGKVKWEGDLEKMRTYDKWEGR